MTCFFQRFTNTPCDYYPKAESDHDPCHLIPKGRLARAGVEDVWQPEWIVAGCRRHHTAFDMKVIRLAESQYPDRFRAHAAKHGFYFAGERDGWRAMHGEVVAT